MENLKQYQWPIFSAFCIAVAVSVLANIVPLLPLYMSAELRSKAGTLIEATATREGWLRSGISIRHISSDGATLLYRSYFRGQDTYQCNFLSFTDGSLAPCQQ